MKKNLLQNALLAYVGYMVARKYFFNPISGKWQLTVFKPPQMQIQAPDMRAGNLSNSIGLPPGAMN